MVTIYDIAKKAGVSSATVSKVLNGYADISFKTAERVKKICEVEGYRPSSVARGLATKKSSTIGIFFTDHLNSGFRHPFLQDVLASFKEVVGRSGYDLIFFTDDHPDNHRMGYLERSSYRHVEGLFLLGISRMDQHLQRLVECKVPCVAVDLDLIGPRSSFFASDNRGGAIKAVDYLAEMGHKEIAFISDIYSTFPGKERLIGFREGMQKNHLTIYSDRIYNSDFSEQGGYEACFQLLENPALPTAIFCGCDLIALGVMKALHEKGVRVPEDVSVIGFDDLELLRYIKPGLTTIGQNKELLGKSAGVELLKMIENPNYYPNTSCFIETELVIRETVKDVRQ
ncbi:LacI family DNA-binding transcriptional regulator [Pullulanibacillus sp. KACC 23026]|uniref:LacI family DNA-binding transcriptional regulator n=1 Tax=Pullulanibacillus sp. KACC 23026 TaxID=3028315 RepID=UPI0023B06EE3|nr:LacI family DNA-binding transcriptional regulator [Pullulanibacillus sp. KACC 23026]WEG13957.1 LacI family DNA-binding transcriptional regulator [Pullulanibacillus sp. KACC 23026]